MYTCDDMEGMVVEMPTFDEWGLIGLHKGSPIIVSYSGEDDNNQDSEATKEEEDIVRIPPPNLHPSVNDLGDDATPDEWR